MKKIFAVLLAATLLVSSLVGCAKEDGTTPDNTGEESTYQEGDLLSDYRITCDFSRGFCLNAAYYLQKELQSMTGQEIELVNSRKSEDDSTFEIVIGKTDRAVSVSALELLDAQEQDSYIIRYAENKIVIAGENETSVYAATKTFVESLSADANGNYVVPQDKSDVLAATPTNIAYFAMENNDIVTMTQGPISTVITSDPKTTSKSLTYARIVMLEHSGDANGTLIATSESLAYNHYIIHRSTDGGATWEEIATVSESQKSGLVANWQPFLYELPEQIGNMPAGTLLLAGCSRDPSTSRQTHMVIWRSDDHGYTWERYSVVDSAGGIDDGVWEPFLYAENGTLYCFYSDDAHEVCSQTIALRTSTDGTTWSETIYPVACTGNPNLRPGMPSITKMSNGQYFLCYEMVGMSGNPIYCKTTDNLLEWDSKSEGTKIVADGKVLGSAPYCAWTPAGGECGTLIVSGSFHGTGSSNTGTDWFLSFDYGETWTAAGNPLPYTYPSPSGVRFAYSMCIYVASDGSLYYVNDIDWEYPKFGVDTRVAFTHLIIE